MHKLIISLGTNLKHRNSIIEAQLLLADKFANMKRFSILTTKGIGECFCNTEFLNTIVTCDTSHNLQDVLTTLKVIESDCGNTQQLRERGIVIVDVDLLQYDDTKLHVDDWDRDYIKQLIKELP